MSDPSSVWDAVADVRALAERCAADASVGQGRAVDTADRRHRAVVLIDGRSGTGKTTLGGVLAGALGAELVHLDDVYPGWSGLRAAADHTVTEVLGPDARWRRWDWTASAPAEWHALDASRPLVVEGCGALSRASATRATTRIWLDGDDDERRRRAIARDGDAFARHWDMWAAQEDAFIAAESPRALADIVLRS